jgi:hypothetical protein
VYVLPTSASAVTACRSDPVVVLSNLKTLDLSATISDSGSDVKSVTYTLHAPRGTFVLAFVPTDALVGRVEHFVFYSDNQSNHYTVTTYASTGMRVPVTASVLNILGRFRRRFRVFEPESDVQFLTVGHITATIYVTDPFGPDRTEVSRS